MVQSAQNGLRPQAGARRFDDMARPGRWLEIEAAVRTGHVVVGHELTQHAPEVAVVQHDHVVETLMPERPHDPLRDRVRLGRLGRREHRSDPKPGGPPYEVPTVVAVAIADEELRGGVPRRRLDHLLPDPRCGRMGRHVPMHDAAPVMADEEEDIQRPQGQRLDREAVAGPDLVGREPEERAPGGGRRRSELPPVAPHRRNAGGEAEGAELANDARRPPAWVLTRSAG